jgi:hypothetical protein
VYGVPVFGSAGVSGSESESRDDRKRRLPIRGGRSLCSAKAHPPSAHKAMQFILNMILFRGSMGAESGFRPEVCRIPSITAEFERNQVILFIITDQFVWIAISRDT